MSAPLTALREVFDVLFQGTVPDWPIKPRNENYDRPTAGDPAKYFYWDFETQLPALNSGEWTRGDPESGRRPRKYEGSLRGSCFIVGGGGDLEIEDFCGRLDRALDAWCDTPAGAHLYFGGVSSQILAYEGPADAPKWAAREFEIEFLNLAQLSDTEVTILSSISSSTMEIYGPGLLVLDWIGLTGEDAYRRVKAADGEPPPLGLVSATMNGGRALVVLADRVRIPSGHGWPVGPLYLSQDTEGAANGPPVQSPSIKLGTVLNSTDIAVKIETSQEASA